MIILFMTVDEVTAVMTAGYTHIRVYSDTSETGDFTTLQGTVALVAATESYSYTHVAGTSATWYRTCYYGAVPGEGDKTTARRGSTSSAYATVTQVRNRIEKTITTSDVELAAILDAATRAIDRFCNRPDGFVADVTASARYYAGSGKTWMYIDECTQITAVAVKDSATDTTYTAWTSPTTAMAGDGDWIPFRGDPLAPEFATLPYHGLMIDPNGDYAVFCGGKWTTRGGFRPLTTYARGLPTVRVTARWGYSDTVPDDIREACAMQAAIWFKRFEGSGASVLASPELGTIELYRTLDPMVEQILRLGAYRLPTTGRR